jgi:hypothetical protein
MTGAELLLVGGIVAGVAGGLSSIQQGIVAKAQGNAQDKMAKYNAKLAERQGKARLDAAKMQSERMSRQQRITEATNAALGAKSGISLSESKSSIEVLADTAFQFHMDRNLILNQGMQDYIQAQNQASLLRAEGAFAKKMGKQAYTSGMVLGAVQLGGAAFMAGSAFGGAGAGAGTASSAGGSTTASAGSGAQSLGSSTSTNFSIF